MTSTVTNRGESATGKGLRRATFLALDGLIVVVSIAALYLCAVILPSALDNTIVYKGF